MSDSELIVPCYVGRGFNPRAFRLTGMDWTIPCLELGEIELTVKGTDETFHMCQIHGSALLSENNRSTQWPN